MSSPSEEVKLETPEETPVLVSEPVAEEPVLVAEEPANTPDVTITETEVKDGLTEVDASLDYDGDKGTVDVNLDQEITLVPAGEESSALVKEIQELALGITGSNATLNMGTMNDYAELYKTVAEYMKAAEERQLKVDLDVECLASFAEAAKNYNELFESVVLGFEKVSAVSDVEALLKLKGALVEINKLYDTINRFKVDIKGIDKITIPDSICKVSDIMGEVGTAIDKSIRHIQIFVGSQIADGPAEEALTTLSSDDAQAIKDAQELIKLWIQNIKETEFLVVDNHECIKAFKSRMDEFCKRTESLNAVSAIFKKRLENWGKGIFN